MTWFRRRHGEELAEATDDLAAAREERLRGQRLARESQSRWPHVFQIVSDARVIRKSNHLVDDIMTIFRGH